MCTWVIPGLLLGLVGTDIHCGAAPMLLSFIIGLMMKGLPRRPPLLSHSDPLVFVQRPISATMLALASMVAVMLPALKKARSGVPRSVAGRTGGVKKNRSG